MTRSCHRRSLFVAVAALLLLAPVLSLTRPAAAQDRPTMRFGVNAADLLTLDPHFASGTQDRTVVDMIFNGLLRFQPGNSAEIEPDLATAIPEPEIVDGKQVWTFQINEGVMCHPTADSEAYELT